MSGLCFISKFVERVVACQLNSCVTSNGLENVQKSAYKLVQTTETALLLIRAVHWPLARGVATTVMLLDHLAAFDTTDYYMLQNSLSSWFVVICVVLDWFKSYLSYHSQCIKIDSLLSDAKKKWTGTFVCMV